MQMPNCLFRWARECRAVSPAWAQVGDLALQLRPVQAADAEPLGEMFARMSARSRQRRFHTAVNQVPKTWLTALSQPDDGQHQTRVLGSVGPGGEALWAEARWCRCSPHCSDGDERCAEFALSVVDALQRRGLGDRLLDALETGASAQGLVWLCGDVECDNQAMLALLRQRGYRLAQDPADPDLVRARRRLGAWL